MDTHYSIITVHLKATDGNLEFLWVIIFIKNNLVIFFWRGFEPIKGRKAKWKNL